MRDYGGIFDIDGKDKEILSLQSKMSVQDFWSDPQAANAVVVKLKSLKVVCDSWHKHESRIKEISEFFSISEGEDQDFLSHLNADLEKLNQELASLEFYTLFSGEFDKNHAILSINAGAGGTESCDWVSMLLRMYTRFSAAHGFDVTVIDILAGEEAGIKNVTAIVKGEYAYGYLRPEIGVHRLVRISPFDANKRRHTSFASVDVIPQIEEAVDIDLKPDEIKVDVFRSGGHGGQSVNTTDSAVRVTHIPTGIVVQCQNERSQYQNKQVAMNILKSRLYEMKRRQQEEKLSREYEKKQKIEWGSQIRSYVLHPYNMVKDHRTEHETGDASGVLDGKIDKFIEAYLRMIKTNQAP